MKKLFFIALCAALLALPAAAQLQNNAGATGDNSFDAPLGGAMVLYDQTDNAAGNGAPDQDFEAAFDTYDAEGADDFDVTFVDGWDVTQINTVGTTGTPGGATVSVDFYTDNGGSLVGGDLVCSYSGLTPVDTMGSFEITLPAACELDQGMHWVAIQTSQSFGTSGQHFWSNRTVQSNAGALWQNPGDGFGSGCTSWDAMTTCGVGGGVNPDFLFQVVGVLGEPDAVITEVPTMGQYGMLALILALGLGGVFVVRRVL